MTDDWLLRNKRERQRRRLRRVAVFLWGIAAGATLALAAAYVVHLAGVRP